MYRLHIQNTLNRLRDRYEYTYTLIGSFKQAKRTLRYFTLLILTLVHNLNPSLFETQGKLFLI